MIPAVHQLLPAAAPHDAITGQAFAWRELLRRWGYTSEIVAEHVHPDLLGTVHRLDRRARRLLNTGSVVLRYALWSATVDTALHAEGPVALCYHNITPGKLLREFNPAVADLCDRGRASTLNLQGTHEYGHRRLELQRHRTERCGNRRSNGRAAPARPPR